MGGGYTAQKKCIPGEGTPHILSEQGANMGGTPRIKTGIFKLGDGLVGGRVAGWPGGWVASGT